MVAILTNYMYMNKVMMYVDEMLGLITYLATGRGGGSAMGETGTHTHSLSPPPNPHAHTLYSHRALTGKIIAYFIFTTGVSVTSLYVV